MHNNIQSYCCEGITRHSPPLAEKYSGNPAIVFQKELKGFSKGVLGAGLQVF